MRIGPLRFASWGESLPWHWRGWAVTWISRRRVINLTLDYEKRTRVTEIMQFKDPERTVADDLREQQAERYGLCCGDCGRCPPEPDALGEQQYLPEFTPEYYGTRHPNSQRFHDLLAEAGALHDVKQADYGKGDDPFANVRSSEDWGMPGWVGAMVRLNDKVKRLQKLGRTGGLMNESAIDSFMDIAVYALIARVLYEEQG